MSIHRAARTAARPNSGAIHRWMVRAGGTTPENVQRTCKRGALIAEEWHAQARTAAR